MNGRAGTVISLEGRAALVTGGSRGLGRAISTALAEAGAFVGVNYRGDVEAARDTIRLIEEKGGNAVLTGFDVADPQAVAAGVADFQSLRGTVDILVNNAGIARDGLLGRMKDGDWEEVLRVNLSGAFNTCRAVGKTMIRNRRGRIVNIASAAGEAGNAGQANYSAAKAGLIGLTKALARELAPRNILVNAVSPGIIEGGMSEGLTQEQMEAIRRHVPLGKVGKPSDVAAAVLFLCSDLADYVTGQVIRVNGGLYI